MRLGVTARGPSAGWRVPSIAATLEPNHGRLTATQ
jgi:hypothetical protein